MKEIIKYIAVGGSAFLAEGIIFVVLNSVGFGLLISQSVSFLCGLCISFFGNKNVTFKRVGGAAYLQSRRRQLSIFLTLGLFNLMITNIIIQLLVNVLDFHEWAAKLVVMIAVVAWNFVLMKRFVFRQTTL